MYFKWLTDFIKKIFGWYNSTTTTTTIITDPSTTTTTTLAGNLDEFTKSVMHTAPQEVVNWPVISTLTVTNQGSLIRLDVDDATRARWPRDANCSINIHCLLFRDGKWHTGPCDKVRPLPSVKEYWCLCVPDGDNRTYLPEKGERAGVVITTLCRHGQFGSEKFRSTIAWLIGR